MNDQDEALQDRIRHRAYRLWEMEGKQEGQSDRYWLRAREQLQAAGESSYPPAQSQGNRT